MPAESAHIAGEIRRLGLIFSAYTLSIIAGCWPDVQLVVPWRVRLLDHVDLLLYRPTICPPITPNIAFCCLVIVVSIMTNTRRNYDI